MVHAPGYCKCGARLIPSSKPAETSLHYCPNPSCSGSRAPVRSVWEDPIQNMLDAFARFNVFDTEASDPLLRKNDPVVLRDMVRCADDLYLAIGGVLTGSKSGANWHALSETLYDYMRLRSTLGVLSAENEVAPSEKGPLLRFAYTNYKGEQSVREAIPLRIHFGSNEWHPEPQWLLTAFDIGKGKERTFAMADMVRTDRPAYESLKVGIRQAAWKDFLAKTPEAAELLASAGRPDVYSALCELDALYEWLNSVPAIPTPGTVEQMGRVQKVRECIVALAGREPSLPDDWTVSASETARKILTQLGYASEASLDPYIDQRRDKIAKMVQAFAESYHANLVAAADDESSAPNTAGQHEWVPSTLGHGETVCKNCRITNREAAALGLLNKCEKAEASV